jgi:hypothetical protein
MSGNVQYACGASLKLSQHGLPLLQYSLRVLSFVGDVHLPFAIFFRPASSMTGRGVT